MAGLRQKSATQHLAQGFPRCNHAQQLGALHGFAKLLTLRGLGVTGPALSA